MIVHFTVQWSNQELRKPHLWLTLTDLGSLSVGKTQESSYYQQSHEASLSEIVSASQQGLKLNVVQSKYILISVLFLNMYYQCSLA